MKSSDALNRPSSPLVEIDPGDPREPQGLYTFALIWIMMAGLLLAALINQERGLTILCLAVLALVFLAWAWSRLTARRVTADVRLNRSRVFPGDEVTLTLSLSHRGWLPVWVQSLMTGDLVSLDDPKRASEVNTVLPGRGHAEFIRTLTPIRRGVYTLGCGRIRAGDLLGWFPRLLSSEQTTELVVFPRLIPVAPPLLPRQEFFGSPGVKVPVTDPVYVLGVRDYQSDRPARAIHWRASARLGRWQEKVFEPSAQAKVLLALDASGFQDADEAVFERTLELIASLSASYSRQGLQVGLIANTAHNSGATGLIADGSIITPSRLLELLARMRRQTTGALFDLLLKKSIPLRGFSVILVALEWNNQLAEVTQFFQSRRSPVTLITARSSESPPMRPCYQVDDLALRAQP